MEPDGRVFQDAANASAVAISLVGSTSAIVSSIEPRELPSGANCCEVGTHACSCPLTRGNFQRLMPSEWQREGCADAGVPLSHTSLHSIDPRRSTGVPGCIESEP